MLPPKADNYEDPRSNTLPASARYAPSYSAPAFLSHWLLPRHSKLFSHHRRKCCHHIWSYLLLNVESQSRWMAFLGWLRVHVHWSAYGISNTPRKRGWRGGKYIRSCRSFLCTLLLLVRQKSKLFQSTISSLERFPCLESRSFEWNIFSSLVSEDFLLKGRRFQAESIC